MQNKIIFDLIVTSREKNYKFERFKESIFKQHGNIDIRVIFVDQKSGNNFETSYINNNLLSEIIQIDKTSISNARNVGISAGLQGQFLCFPDDDCWYGEDTLLKVKKIFEIDHKLDCLCVNVYDPIQNLNYGNRPKGIVKNIDYSNIFKLPISVGIFIRKNVFNEVGSKFCEDLGAGTLLGSGEETALIYKLLKSDKKIIYDGRISVFHEVARAGVGDKKVLSYARGYGYLASEIIADGHYIVLINLFSTIFRSVFAFLVYGIFSNRSKFYFLRILGIYQGFLIKLNMMKSENGKQRKF